jgi:hypothetical protein
MHVLNFYPSARFSYQKHQPVKVEYLDLVMQGDLIPIERLNRGGVNETQTCVKHSNYSLSTKILENTFISSNKDLLCIVVAIYEANSPLEKSFLKDDTSLNKIGQILQQA